MTVERFVERPRRVAFVRMLNRILPLRHRYRRLLGSVAPDARFAVPWCGGKLLFPGKWLESFSQVRHVVEGVRCMPELRLAEQLLGQIGSGTVVDVGAHVGQFTLWAHSRGARRIVAVEPDSLARGLLEESIALSECEGIRVIGAACGAECGRTKMHTGPVSRVAEAGSRADEGVLVTTVDVVWDEAGPVGLVKVDVEGFEAQVLRGAGGLIRHGRAALLIEIHPHLLRAYGDDVRDVVEMLRETYDLTLWQFEPGPTEGPMGRMLWRSGLRGPIRLARVTEVSEALIAASPAQVYLVARPMLFR